MSGRRYGEKRPVWVLTSSETFSAAEELAYNLQTLKRGTVVGETTGGGANHNMFAIVGKRFLTSIPIGTTKSPVTGTNWEGVGVKPTIAVASAKALEAALAAARHAVARHTTRRSPVARPSLLGWTARPPERAQRARVARGSPGRKRIRDAGDALARRRRRDARAL